MAKMNAIKKEPIIRQPLKSFDNTDVLPQLTLMPWSCNHHRNYSEIESYNVVSGKREVITSIFDGPSVSAESVVEFIALAVNEFGPSRDLVRQMAAALELCMECDLTWEAEYEADVLLRRAYQIIGKE